MKVKSNLRAGGMSLEQCQQKRDYWHAQADKMEALANKPMPKPIPPYNPYPPYNPPYNPYPPQPTPIPPTPGGGWVGGVWYADRSGMCG